MPSWPQPGAGWSLRKAPGKRWLRAILISEYPRYLHSDLRCAGEARLLCEAQACQPGLVILAPHHLHMRVEIPRCQLKTPGNIKIPISL